MPFYVALNLTEASRQKIWSHFPPRFSEIKADHITWDFGVERDVELPEVSEVRVHAYVCDESLEALIVSVNGSTQRLNRIFHVTLSRSADRKSSQSNTLAFHTNKWRMVAPFALHVTVGINETD